jgi:4-phytase/acid phosphatase
VKPRRIITALTAALCLAAGSAKAAPAGDGLTVERIVLLMRHGVRSPTKDPPLPAGIAADPWPRWPVAPGDLTPHGADAVRLLGRFDRAMLADAGVLPATGCPAPGTVSVVSDSDQRTIATGDAWLDGLAPGCGIANAHHVQDDPDPLFSPLDEGATTLDVTAARAAVLAAAGPGGIAGVETAQHDALARIDRIYCGAARSGCGVTALPSGLAPDRPGKRPKLSGALDIGSTAAQILLLEYTDGWPLADIGWGRASREDIAAAGALHATEFALLARPGPIAVANIAPIAARMLAALTDSRPAAPRLTLLVGHDTNVASLGGLLDLHWRADGFAANDPPPGGALGFELLRDRHGNRFVRAIFRSQSIDQMRELTPLAGAPSPLSVLPIPECAAGEADGACPLAAFAQRWQQLFGLSAL